jgi:hypothetical protein
VSKLDTPIVLIVSGTVGLLFSSILPFVDMEDSSNAF